jgi:D-psicose/D-tagatose/L-ribulose 3-epimerase
MKYSVSNIAWLPSQDVEVASILRKTHITGIEIAPSRYFENVERATLCDFDALRKHWQSLGFEITSLQSLLFNRMDLQLFGNTESRTNLSSYLKNLGQKASLLGAGPMVFGSPRNRDRGHLTNEEAETSARAWFKEVLSEWGDGTSYLVIEANPEVYECNFLTKSSEALEFVQSVNDERLKWHLDLACTEASLESSVDLIHETAILPSHVHVSELNLGPLKSNCIPLYQNFMKALALRKYKGVVTLEMKKTNNFSDLQKSIAIFESVIP